MPVAGARADGVTALLVAGRRPGIDPLAQHFGVADKALIDVAGESMLSRVARTLVEHPDIARVIVLAQEPDRLLGAEGTRWMAGHPRIATLAGGSSVSAAVDTALGADPDGWPFLVTAADNVLLDAETLDAFIAGARASGADVAIGLVERRVFRARFADARRTWLEFRGGAFSGANLFYLARPTAIAAVRFWRRVESERKRVRAIARAFGPALLAAYLLRLLTARHAIAWAGRKLGVVAVPVVLPNPCACIDVDTPDDHVLAEAVLAAR